MTKKSKTIFIEYSSANKGQHFMTVVQTENHNRTIIGRIFREYDTATKKTKYLATDFAGNRVFVDDKDLSTLKRHFIESGKSLAQAVLAIPRVPKQNERQIFPPKVERSNTIKQTREKKTSKEKTKEVVIPKSNEKPNANPQNKELKVEKTEREKDLENFRGKNTTKENTQEKEERNPEIQNVDDQKSTEPNDERSERESELDDIREQNEDREQDVEIDL